MNVEKFKPVADLISSIADESFPILCKGPSYWPEFLESLEVECDLHQKRYPQLDEGFIYGTVLLVLGGIIKEEVPFLYSDWVCLLCEGYPNYEEELQGAIVLSFAPDLDPLCRALVDSSKGG